MWHLVCEKHFKELKEKKGIGWCEVYKIETYEDPTCDVEGCEKAGKYEVYDIDVNNVDTRCSSFRIEDVDKNG